MANLNCITSVSNFNIGNVNNCTIYISNNCYESENTNYIDQSYKYISMDILNKCSIYLNDSVEQYIDVNINECVNNNIEFKSTNYSFSKCLDKFLANANVSEHKVPEIPEIPNLMNNIYISDIFGLDYNFILDNSIQITVIFCFILYTIYFIFV